jgi:hypothetical protein
LTLREFDALQERAEIETDWQNWRAGLISSVLANINRDPKKGKPFTPQDFMPGKAKPPEEAKGLTPEEVLDDLRRKNAFIGGTEITK